MESTSVPTSTSKSDSECWDSLTSYGGTGKYADFGVALRDINDEVSNFSAAHTLAKAIKEGVEAAAAVAKSHGMVRAFAIAPTASCSYRSTDLDGFTSCPEDRTIGRTVDRDSGTFGVQTFDYGDVEIASEVSWENYKLVTDQIMIMLDKTGLLHGYSFNSWSDAVTYDNSFVEEWLKSPQTSLYYSLQVMGDVQDRVMHTLHLNSPKLTITFHT